MADLAPKFANTLVSSVLVDEATGQFSAALNEARRKGLGSDPSGITTKTLSHRYNFLKDSTKPHNKVGMRTEDFSKHLVKAGSFTSLQELAIIWGRMIKYKKLHMYSNIRLFREPIQPLWEDPHNREGGRFVILLNIPIGQNVSEKADHSDSEEEDLLLKSPRGPAYDPSTPDPSQIEIPYEYLMIILHMVTGLLGPETSFAGCVLSIRRFGTMITLWNTDANDKAWIEHVRDLLARLLNLSLESIVYQRHNKSLRNNARNLSKQSSKRKKKAAQQRGEEHTSARVRSVSDPDPSEPKLARSKDTPIVRLKPPTANGRRSSADNSEDDSSDDDVGGIGGRLRSSISSDDLRNAWQAPRVTSKFFSSDDSDPLVRQSPRTAEGGPRKRGVHWFDEEVKASAPVIDITPPQQPHDNTSPQKDESSSSTTVPIAIPAKAVRDRAATPDVASSPKMGSPGSPTPRPRSRSAATPLLFSVVAGGRPPVPSLSGSFQPQQSALPQQTPQLATSLPPKPISFGSSPPKSSVQQQQQSQPPTTTNINDTASQQASSRRRGSSSSKSSPPEFHVTAEAETSPSRGSGPQGRRKSFDKVDGHHQASQAGPEPHPNRRRSRDASSANVATDTTAPNRRHSTERPDAPQTHPSRRASTERRDKSPSRRDKSPSRLQQDTANTAVPATSTAGAAATSSPENKSAVETRQSSPTPNTLDVPGRRKSRGSSMSEEKKAPLVSNPFDVLQAEDALSSTTDEDSMSEAEPSGPVASPSDSSQPSPKASQPEKQENTFGLPIVTEIPTEPEGPRKRAKSRGEEANKRASSEGSPKLSSCPPASPTATAKSVHPSKSASVEDPFGRVIIYGAAGLAFLLFIIYWRLYGFPLRA